MCTQEFKFKENKTYENGNKFAFEFEGIKKENMNLSRVNYLLNRFMEGQDLHGDMIKMFLI